MFLTVFGSTGKGSGLCTSKITYVDVLLYGTILSVILIFFSSLISSSFSLRVTVASATAPSLSLPRCWATLETKNGPTKRGREDETFRCFLQSCRTSVSPSTQETSKRFFLKSLKRNVFETFIYNFLFWIAFIRYINVLKFSIELNTFFLRIFSDSHN